LLAATVAAVLLARFVARGRRRARPGRADPSGARRTPLPPPSDFYDRALSLLARAGERRRQAETPREFLLRLEHARGPRVHAFRPITLAFEGSRYGLVPVTSDDDRRLIGLLDRLRTDLFPQAEGSGREG
jgi:hypothetical protein